MAISIPIISEFKPQGIDKAISEFKRLEGAGAKAKFVIGKAAKVANVALAGLGASAVTFAKAAAEDAQSAALLEQALKQTAKATDAQVSSAEDFISKLSMSAGVVDDQLRPALATLSRATGSVTQSQDLLAVALDASAATGKPVEEIAKSLARAYSGNLGALNKLLPGMIDTKDESIDFGKAMEILGDKVGGAAAIAADEKPFDKLQISLDETKEAIGAQLLPVVEKVTGALLGMSNWAQKHPDTFKKIAGAIAAVATAITAINVAMKIYTAISATLIAVNAALTSSYLTLYAATGVGVILAIVGAIALLNSKFQFMDNVVGALKTAFTATFDALKIAIDVAWEAIKGMINKFGDLWNNTVGKLSFKVPSWVPGLGGKGFDIPDIPKLANGGIVTAPTLALIGEAGPEAVVPLDRAGGMGNNITIHVNGGDPNAVVDALRRYMKTNGSVPIRVSA